MSHLVGKYRVALKRISDVEASRDKSNQHEFNGTSALKEMLGKEPRRGFPGQWVFLQDYAEPRTEELTCSWYDAREKHATRSEWRLYFNGSPPLNSGDLLVLVAREGPEELLLLVAPQESSWATQLVGLFGDPDRRGGSFVEGRFELIPPGYAAVAQELFDVLGWSERALGATGIPIDELLHRFGGAFPETREFSSFARDVCPVGPVDDPDHALLSWWECEESLFRALEDHLLQARLALTPPFQSTDEFIRFSLSVQNRRKSRAGHAFEHHVAALLEAHGLTFSRTSKTEGDRRPDFILPGIESYRDLGFDADRLTMLAAKTTCKDRWRQILNEARRIPEKHLATLEAGISDKQLDEMREERVVLVAPATLHPTYPARARGRVLSVREFIALATERQG